MAGRCRRGNRNDVIYCRMIDVEILACIAVIISVAVAAVAAAAAVIIIVVVVVPLKKLILFDQSV